MIWRYYIPHEWDPPGERTSWADVLLLPDAPAYADQALWLTVDAIPQPASEQSRKDLKRRRSQLAWIGRADYRLDTNKMDLTVRADDFTKAECLAWVERWLGENFTCTGLVEGTVDDFAGRNSMADLIVSLRDRDTGA